MTGARKASVAASRSLGESICARSGSSLKMKAQSEIAKLLMSALGAAKPPSDAALPERVGSSAAMIGDPTAGVPPRRWCLILSVQYARNALAAAVQPGGDRRLAGTHGAGSLSVGQAKDAYGHERDPEQLGAASRSRRTLPARRERLFGLSIGALVRSINVPP